ncbi:MULTISPECIES: hypothetical protein [Tsukamurella]|uniref:Uncharacterized protein n=1 Tax=Tsukamurella strandjordii TaxID=147577 RepID=A0AA90SMH1_9ACTN|nr:hypothetical protein [Tsukamurella strandjordii]MDP0399218.1 hypothetical protein [Tsukamurella strandjordii]
MTGYFITAAAALLVGFFGGRVVDVYKRAQDRRDELTLAADDVLDVVAQMHEDGGMTQEAIGTLLDRARGLRRAASRYLDGREVDRSKHWKRRDELAARLRRLVMSGHDRHSDWIITSQLHLELRYRIRDLPTWSEKFFAAEANSGGAHADYYHDQALSEVRYCAQIALRIRDAATGRPWSRNRGGSTARYLFNQGRLPNLTLTDRVAVGGAEIDKW